MQWLLYLLYAIGFTYIIYKWRFFDIQSVSKKIIVGAFICKVLAGLGITLLYTYYYTDKSNADIYKYFDDGLLLNSLAYSNPKMFFKLLFEVDIETPEVLKAIKNFNHWDPKVRSYLYNDNRIIIKLNALIAFVSARSIYIHSLFASFIGFIGLVALVKATEQLLEDKTTFIYALLLFFFPSVLMWSSAMLKETILVMVLGLFVWQLSLFKHKYKQILYWLSVLVLLVLLGISKVYVLLCFVVSLGFYFVIAKISTRSLQLAAFTVAYICLPVAVVAVDTLLFNNLLLNSLAKKQWDSIRLAHYMNAGSIVYIPPVSADSLQSFAIAAPVAIWNVLFEPMIWNVKSPVVFPLAIENIGIALLLFTTLYKMQHLHLRDTRVIYSIFLFCLLLFLIIGITTPVLGSIVRYRVPGVLFLLLSFAIGIEHLLNNKAKG